MISNVLTPSSLINNTNTNSSTVSILSPSTSFDDHHLDGSPQLLTSKSVESSVKKPTKPRSRTRKSTPPTPVPIPIAPNLGRPLAPAPLNVQRIVTSTTKRSISTTKKRPSKSLLLPTTMSSPPIDPFAESISGLMQHFDQELIASNFVSTTNILSQDTSNGNLLLLRTFDHQTENCSNAQDFSVDNELINEEEMNLVEMNFDENTFLKQFDFDETSMKLTQQSDDHSLSNLLNPRQNSLNTSESHSSYPGSSLINNNVFTTFVPLTVHQSSRCLPEEGVQLT